MLSILVLIEMRIMIRDWGLGIGDWELVFGIILVLIEMRIRIRTRQKMKFIPFTQNY